MATERLNSIILKAQQGDPNAIAELLNAALMPQSIVTRATGLKNCLIIFANGQNLPGKESIIGIIERGFTDLEIDSIARVKVYGKSTLNPEDAWSDEIVFFDNLPNADKALDRISRKALKRSAAGLLAGASSRSRKLLANKRVVYSAIGLAVVGLAVWGGLAGLRLVQARSAYATTINEAQALVSEAAVSENDGTEQLESKLTQLKKARQLLRSIPESKSNSYKSAQKELGTVSQKIESIEATLSDVELVAGKLSDISGAVNNALSEVSQPPYAVDDWNKAKQALISGVTRLESIPQYGPLAEKIKSQIEEYQDKVVWIDQAIANEQVGVSEWAKAKGLARDAYSITNGKRKFTVSDLAKARDKWQAAIDQAKKVPPTTDAYRSVSEGIDIYTKNKNNVVDGIYEINNCSYRDSEYESMKDLCYSVYLSLTKPD